MLNSNDGAIPHRQARANQIERHNARSRFLCECREVDPEKKGSSATKSDISPVCQEECYAPKILICKQACIISISLYHFLPQKQHFVQSSGVGVDGTPRGTPILQLQSSVRLCHSEEITTSCSRFARMVVHA